MKFTIKNLLNGKVGVSPEVNALATILLGLSLVLVLISQLILRDRTGKA